MDTNILIKVRKLYRIQDAFEKYNIFDKNAFVKDECFKYILDNYNVESKFHEEFNEKYKQDILQSNAYKKHNKTKHKKEKNMENNEDSSEKTNIEEESCDTEDIENHDKDTETMNIREKTPIQEFERRMFKRIVFLCHPDKSKKHEDGVIFKRATDNMKNHWTIGLMYCCFLLNIKIKCNKMEDDMKIELFKQMRKVIEEIIHLYNIRNS